MNQTRYAINAYQAAQRTTPPLKMVVMLYDGILARIARAGDAARRGDFQAQFEAVMSAARIIDGLNRHLDMEKGGDVAIRLRDTYESVGRALFRSVGKESGAEACDRLLIAVRELRDAWAEIAGEKLLAVDMPEEDGSADIGSDADSETDTGETPVA